MTIDESITLLKFNNKHIADGNEDLYDNSYKYCPYCGKKIRMVE